LRRFNLACAGLLACCCAAAPGVSKAHAEAKTNRAAGREQARIAAIAWLGGKIHGYQHATWRWEQLMGARQTPTAGRMLAKMSIPDVERAVHLWKHRAHAARVRAQHPPHLAAWLCIHHYEGAWSDSSGPYYGGLQMDLGFQETYGARLLRTKGTADHWTPLEQIWTAEKASRSRGFWPWPNSARICGLI
jgi:hypothetical protein